MRWDEFVGTERCLLHSEHMIAGSVTDYFDGVDNCFVDQNGNRISKPVVKLDNGHSLIADPSKFVELTLQETKALRGLQTSMSGLIAIAVKQMAEAKLDQITAFTLIRAVLLAHLGVVSGAITTLHAKAVKNG